MNTRRWVIWFTLVAILGGGLGGYIYYLENRLWAAEYTTEILMRRIFTLENRVDNQEAIDASFAETLREKP
jgi:hypothetical protein